MSELFCMGDDDRRGNRGRHAHKVGAAAETRRVIRVRGKA